MEPMVMRAQCHDQGEFMWDDVRRRVKSSALVTGFGEEGTGNMMSVTLQVPPGAAHAADMRK